VQAQLTAALTNRAVQTPNKNLEASTNLSSLVEREEEPAGVQNNMDSIVSSAPQTPAASTPAKPPFSEMHPSYVHTTMAAAPSSGLRLGFTDIKPAARNDRSQPSGITQSTPSRTMPPPSSPFTFRFTKENSDLQLGPDAQRMMDEIREEALKIKADLAAKRELEAEEQRNSSVGGRKIAKAKGKAGRFSAAHMAQFKKMDSIENHPSAYRVQPGRSTTMSAGVKRSPSKAELDDANSSRSKPYSFMSSAKSSRIETSSDLPRTSSPKRARKRSTDDDDAGSRPISRDDSNIPRPKSAGKGAGLGIPRSHTTLASLMTPTQSSLARSAATKDNNGILTKSPSVVNLGAVPRSATTTTRLGSKVSGVSRTPSNVTVRSPGSRFSKMKSMLRTGRGTPVKAGGTGLPQSLTISELPLATNATLSEITTSEDSSIFGQGFSKRSLSTPQGKRQAVIPQSPSLKKSGIPKSQTRAVLGSVTYPILDSIMDGEPVEDEVHYPELPSLPLEAASDYAKAEPAVPSTFTFRSDHTISFGQKSPNGFGGSAGQSTLRHVRQSILPTVDMPGSFPASIFSPKPAQSKSADKENKPPLDKPLPAIPHGINNKKRHRVSTDEEDAEREAEERAAKKQRQGETPEGLALVAPRFAGLSSPIKKREFAAPSSPMKHQMTSPSKLRTPGGGMSTPSPVKRKAVMSLSRLNMLARPKMRK
jgi:hypothetical protein